MFIKLKFQIVNAGTIYKLMTAMTLVAASIIWSMKVTHYVVSIFVFMSFKVDDNILAALAIVHLIALCFAPVETALVCGN